MVPNLSGQWTNVLPNKKQHGVQALVSNPHHFPGVQASHSQTLEYSENNLWTAHGGKYFARSTLAQFIPVLIRSVLSAWFGLGLFCMSKSDWRRLQRSGDKQGFNVLSPYWV